MFAGVSTIEPQANAAPTEETAVIVAQSERQAWDWSLVLTSQAIEVTVRRASDGGRWQLVVPAADEVRARNMIRDWRVENRGWHWRRQIPESSLEFHWGALLWVFALVILHSLSMDLWTPAAFRTEAVRSGDWWRAFTAVWLHADLGHLVSNAILGGVILGIAMGQYGVGNALLAGLICGAAGNFFAMQVRTLDYIGLGASGWVMGILGLLAARGVALWRLS